MFDKTAFLKRLSDEKHIRPANIVDLDTSEVVGRCCENILGFKPTPLGISHNPLRINGKEFYIPIATTEGCLVASMCRGIKLLGMCGLLGYSENLGISRSFTQEFASFEEAVKFYAWLKDAANKKVLQAAGSANSRFCVIKSISSKFVVGRQVLIKVTAYTGDAMGMNMITKACGQISDRIAELFDSQLVSISSNICTDKKASAENMVNGRGRRVFLHCVIPNEKCRQVLRVDISQLKKVYDNKMLGSKLVSAGFNCQASNYVSAIFLALNQDMGQVIESSNCTLEMTIEGDDLCVSLLMPSITVGAVGGGTHLEPARSFLQQFNCSDEYCLSFPADNSRMTGYLSLATAGAVLAGELSLLAAIADNTLISAHMKLNRKKDSQ